MSRKKNQPAVKKSVSKPSVSEAAKQVPLVGTPVIDKLCYILPVLVGPLYTEERVPEKMMRRIEKALEKDQCTRWYTSESRFRLQLRIDLPSGARAQVQIGAKKPLEQKGGVRIELNPSKLLKGDVEHLYELVGRWLKGFGELDDLLTRARISRMDVAVNVIHCAIDDLLISYKGAHQFTVFGNTMKGGKFQTINFGSMSSDYIAAVYNKRDEALRKILRQAEEGGAHETLKAAFISQLKVAAGMPPTMRVEVRGMKVGASVGKLLKLGNKRFQRFVFVETKCIAGLTEFERRSFIALVRDVGLKEAVALHKGQPTYKLVKAAASESAIWWQPDGLWERGIKALRKSGIFPKEAFDHRG